jgi:DNA invertase Pin-like site-specific DNA recombinase
MQELEDATGVRMVFENEFCPGAAGAFSFNVMAAVSQYYSDNLRQEVRKGQDEKIRQGWMPCGVPYGYMNTRDPEEPIRPDPEKAKLVVRIFQLYTQGGPAMQMITGDGVAVPSAGTGDGVGGPLAWCR